MVADRGLPVPLAVPLIKACKFILSRTGVSEWLRLRSVMAEPKDGKTSIDGAKRFHDGNGAASESAAKREKAIEPGMDDIDSTIDVIKPASL
eukprot:TRINITY_DN6953_c0_g1_i2.p1 TRINITY_DN6953_c0_g1~~TRINITY_DN6953_c0_g1_i2.p1  ORF type:complete len:104 (+),score=10.82 TRINITY_DN6953_c0_g1_i2:39-314(+)